VRETPAPETRVPGDAASGFGEADSRADAPRQREDGSGTPVARVVPWLVTFLLLPIIICALIVGIMLLSGIEC